MDIRNFDDLRQIFKVFLMKGQGHISTSYCIRQALHWQRVEQSDHRAILIEIDIGSFEVRLFHNFGRMKVTPPADHNVYISDTDRCTEDEVPPPSMPSMFRFPNIGQKALS